MGIDENGVPKDSQNHYAPGAATAWLFSHVGGIRPLKPGFSEVQIAPFPVADLDWAETSFGSIYGTISSRWERSNGKFRLHVSLPEGVRGVAILPDGSEHRFTGSSDFLCDY